MMKHLIKHMFAEYEDFMEYYELYEDCTDPAHRVEFKKIAEEEMHHYKMIYDMVFPKTAHEEGHWTPVEKGVYDYATRIYNKMAEHVAKMK